MTDEQIFLTVLISGGVTLLALCLGFVLCLVLLSFALKKHDPALRKK